MSGPDTYSNIGPECPYCGIVITPDTDSFYDEVLYTEQECPECGKKYSVQVHTDTTWICETIEEQ